MDLLKLIQIILFLSGTIILVFISRKSLRNFKVHGFYRFFVFEFTLTLVILNLPYWFKNPFSLQQILSWVFLLASIVLIFQSVFLIKKIGGHEERGENSINYKFENTSNLVKEGVYKYIRHPMYSSLLFLSLGTLLKNFSVYAILLAAFAILFILITAKTEEKENISFFGSSYTDYIKETKMFIPYIF